jgi:ectoine hydroxylase-related dioxygenase (phytanoyl-CoA dioxygenase family)
MRYALHPRNTEFVWRQSVPPYRRLGVDDVRSYGDNGYIAVRNAFSRAEVAEVVAAIDPLEAQTETFLRSRDGGTLEHRWTPLGFQCLDDVEGAVPIELAAGSIAVFSSLTPHRTGPNLTAEVRKAYILQYAGDGAIAYPQGKDPTACDAPDRQYVVLREGNPV